MSSECYPSGRCKQEQALIYEPFSSLTPPQPIFVHIGKTGGSTLKRAFPTTWKKSIHLKKPKHKHGNSYITVVRDPIDRVISAYNHYLAATQIAKNSDIKKTLQSGSPIHQSPAKLAACRNEPVIWKSVDDWAKSLGNSDSYAKLLEIDKNALSDEICHIGIKHILRGYQYYLSDLPADAFIYIGQTEDFDECLRVFSEILGTTPKKGIWRKNGIVTNKYLSPEGRKNLEMFLEPEYRFLREKFGIDYKTQYI